MGLLFLKGGNSPWSPELYPEMIAQGFFKADLSPGAVASWLSRGFTPLTAVQATGANRPTKLAGNGGVKFDKDSIQSLSWGVETNTADINRGGICISSCDIDGNAAETGVPVVTINGATAANGSRQPYVQYVCNTGKYEVQRYDVGGSRLHSDDADTALADKNILVWFVRGWQFFSIINGVWQTPIDILSMSPNASLPSFFGANSASVLKADVILDLWMTFQGEISDAFAWRLDGWAHWEEGKQPPIGHLYRNQRPLVTPTSAAEDFPELFAFSLAEWNAAIAANGTSVRYAHRGEAAPAIDGDYRLVFDEHFTAATIPVKDDRSGAKGSSLYAPGIPNSYGIEAVNRYPSDTTAYVYDPSGDGTLSLVLYDSGGDNWKVGSFASVNEANQGRSWEKGTFEYRFRWRAFDGATPLDLSHVGAQDLPGFWWAMWDYSEDRRFHYTRNPMEIDLNEQVGKEWGRYTFWSIHMHDPPIANSFSGVYPTDLSKKVVDYRMDTATDADFATPIDTFDGNWHVIRRQIDDDFTYFAIDEKELARWPTTRELSDRKYMIASIQLSAAQGLREPLTTEKFMLDLDYARVFQREDFLATVKPGFSARPTIAGTTTSGSTLTITPNTVGTQIDYFWYRDGVPLTTALASTYVLVAGDVGHKIFGEVRNLSLVNRPSMMTAETATVS